MAHIRMTIQKKRSDGTLGAIEIKGILIHNNTMSSDEVVEMLLAAEYGANNCPTLSGLPIVRCHYWMTDDKV